MFFACRAIQQAISHCCSLSWWAPLKTENSCVKEFMMEIINWFVLISSAEHSDSVLFVFGVRCALNQLRLCFEADPLAFHHGSRESRRQKECFKAVKCFFSLSSVCLVTIIILHHLMSTARTAPSQSIEKNWRIFSRKIFCFVCFA